MFRRIFYSTISNEQGYSLLLAIFAIAIFTVLGLSIFTISANTKKISTNEREDQAVYYLAEAGLVEKKAELETIVQEAFHKTLQLQEAHYSSHLDPMTQFNFEETFLNYIENDIITIQNHTEYSFTPVFNNPATALVTIQKDTSSPNLTYKIQSIGRIGTKQERIVNQTFSIKFDPVTTEITIENSHPSNPSLPIYSPPCTGVHVSGTMQLNGNTTINGTIFSPSKDKSGHTINDSKYLSQIQWNTPFNFTLPDFPPDSTFTSLSRLPAIDLNSNVITLNNDIRVQNFNTNEITINVGDADRNIYFENLQVSGKTVNIIGNGKVNIYVNNEFTVNSNGNKTGLTINHSGTPNDLMVYVKGNSNFNGGFSIDGSIYVKNSGVHINKDSTVSGFIYAGNGDVKINGQAETTIGGIFAPNSNIHLNGGAEIKTSIVAGTFTANGGSTLNITENDSCNNPPPDTDQPGIDNTFVKVIGSDIQIIGSPIIEVD